MIEKDDITQMVKHILRRERGIPDRRIMHPSREWLIGLSLATLLLLTTATYAGYAFFIKTSAAALRPNAESDVVRYKQEAASEVLTRYQEKKQQFASLRANTPVNEIEVSASPDETTATTSEPLAEDDTEE